VPAAIFPSRLTAVHDLAVCLRDGQTSTQRPRPLRHLWQDTRPAIVRNGPFDTLRAAEQTGRLLGTADVIEGRHRIPGRRIARRAAIPRNPPTQPALKQMGNIAPGTVFLGNQIDDRSFASIKLSWPAAAGYPGSEATSGSDFPHKWRTVLQHPL